MAINLDEREVGAVLLGDFVKVKENDTVKTTGRIVQVPAGKGTDGAGAPRPSRYSPSISEYLSHRCGMNPRSGVQPCVSVRPPKL